MFRRFSVLFVLLLSSEVTACTSASSSEFSIAPSATTAPDSLAVTPQAVPTLPTRFAVEQLPQIPALVVQLELDAEGALRAAHYVNSEDTRIAIYDPDDRIHNSRMAWTWGSMTRAEKAKAVQWIFDPKRMRYLNFRGREEWVVNAVSQRAPRITDFTLPAEPAIAQLWQSDGPPMSETTLYEALSRVKSLSLVTERRTCNYGYSDLGLIEFGGETILFTAPGWEKVSRESREIFTTVWTIKEALVIYYPQSLGWSNSCPSEGEHMKIELYSTIWLLKMEQVLAAFVPSDRGYWEELEIPFQRENIMNQKFPPCASPATSAGLLACFSVP